MLDFYNCPRLPSEYIWLLDQLRGKVFLMTKDLGLEARASFSLKICRPPIYIQILIANQSWCVLKKP